MNAADEVETWWTRCVVITRNAFQPHDASRDNRDRYSSLFPEEVSTGGAPEREVVTDRGMEAWYHPSIA